MVQLRGPINVSTPVRVEAPMASDSSWLEIDLTRLERNFLALRSLVETTPDSPSEPAADTRPAKSEGPATPPVPPIVCCVFK